MKKKLLLRNTEASSIAQVTSLVCGFILPRLFLHHFGSEVNGLVNSISQFLSVISFLELGVGAVVESSLYRPLAEKDTQQISKIMSSANKFFHRLAQILLVYVIFLMLFYSLIVNKNFGFFYTSTLIFSIAISSFAQYYFGIANSLLLNADQKGYIQYKVQTITTILNTIVCSIMVSLNGSIHAVKFTTSLIYLARPLVLQIYVDKHYKLDLKIKYKEEPIKQKWNGIAQHIASVVLDGTDTIVLTIFSTLSNVSIYSVYFLVVRGIKTLFLSATNGIQSLIGELWAKQELKQLKELFSLVEWIIHTGTIYVFSCTAILIVPFVRVYTLGINDANYIQPAFAVLLTVANAIHCLRLPYNIMVLAAGHYKQTQKNYIIAAVLNILFSIMTVKAWGLIGVAIGTLVAMIYQTIWLAIYDSKHFVFCPLKNTAKQFLIDGLSVFFVVMISAHISLKETSYISWIYIAIQVAIEILVVIMAINFCFYRDKVILLVNMIKKH